LTTTLAAAAAAAAVIVALQSPFANAQYFQSVDEAYAPNEDRQSFELVMNPYPIPAETTTYVDIFFNLPDDLPDFFHVTYGEVINSQPTHLHHFVLTGCPEKIDPSQDGEAAEFEMMITECLQPIAVWAPGSDLFGNVDTDTGVLMGRGIGIQALQLNVHYTDGVYADEALKTLKMAMDGIRIHYTSTFRPYSSLSKELINVVNAPKQLTIPPGESRFYLSRTCKVETSCEDATKETLETLENLAFFVGITESDVDGLLGGAEISCESIRSLCNIGGAIGTFVLQLCPATCGFCEKGTDGAINPLNPDTYRVTAVQYHAHLLGREMYTTLLRDEEEPGTDTTSAVERQAPTNTIAKDLQSRDFWIYDNQETIPFEFDVVKNDTIMRGTEIKAGDRIQATCVFDSTYRTDPTYFDLSTYDEMCINWIRVTFETPASLMMNDDEGELDVPSNPLDLGLELLLRLFRCADDAGGDVYSGILTPDEDGRDIWKDHPVDQAEGCTYITSEFFQGVLTEQTRNCEPENLVCGADVEFLSENNAGATCDGGTFDQEDANVGVTEEACEDGGGDYQPYSCGDINLYLNFEAANDGLDQTTISLLVNDWWKPKCCGDAVSIAQPEFVSLAGFGAKQNGFCVRSNGSDQNAGVEKLHTMDYYDEGDRHKQCLEMCAAVVGVTGCEMIWDQDNRGCYAHTDNIDGGGNGKVRHSCYLVEEDPSAEEEPSSQVESPEDEPEVIVVPSAAPGFVKSPWGFVSVGSIASVLSVVLWG